MLLIKNISDFPVWLKPWTLSHFTSSNPLPIIHTRHAPHVELDEIFVITLIQKLLDQAKDIIFYQRNESNGLLQLGYTQMWVWCSGHKSKTYHSIWFYPSTVGILLRAIKEPQLKPFCSMRNAYPLPHHSVLLKGIIYIYKFHLIKKGWKNIINTKRGWLNFNRKPTVFGLSWTVASTGLNLQGLTKQTPRFEMKLR